MVKKFHKLTAVFLSAIMTVTAAPLCASAHTLAAEPKMEPAGDFYTVFRLPDGSELKRDGVPSDIGFADYTLYFKGNEILSVGSAAGNSGSASEVGDSGKFDSYYYVEFALSGNRSCFATGMFESASQKLQSTIIQKYKSGEMLDIYDYSGFIDVEKTSLEDNDDNLCWAAQCANVLTYTGWETWQPSLFDYYVKNFTNEGTFVDTGYCWYFNGVLGTNSRFVKESDCAVPTNPDAGNKRPKYPYDMQFECGEFLYEPAQQLGTVAEALRFGKGVGVNVDFYIDEEYAGSHALSCWGFVENNSVPADSPEHYESLIISDSDSDMNPYNYNGDVDKFTVLPIIPFSSEDYGDTYEAPEYSDCTTLLSEYVIVRRFKDGVKETDIDAKLDKRNYSDFIAYDLYTGADDLTFEHKVVSDTSDIYLRPAICNAGDVDFDGELGYYVKIADENGNTVIDTANTENFELPNYIYGAGDNALNIGKLPAGDYTVTVRVNHLKKVPEAYYINNTLETDLYVRELDFNPSSLGITASFDDSDPDYPGAELSCTGFDKLSGGVDYSELMLSTYEDGEWSPWTYMEWENDENELPYFSEDLPFLDGIKIRFRLSFVSGENPETDIISPVYDFTEIKPGDTNHDGLVNIKDVTLVQKHIAGLLTLKGTAKDNADANRDSIININDATAIQKKIAGIA